MRLLADLFPGSAHVQVFGLQTASDEAVWRQAAEGGFVLVAKDDDFRQLAFLRGAPPKIIWVALGNCSTAQIEAALRARHTDIMAFEADPMAALFVITRPR